MKVGIIAANNIRYSPYIYFYTNILDDLNISYELIYPNRNGVTDEFNGVAHIVSWNNNMHTALDYLYYSRKVKKIIKANKYDFLIVLTGNNAAFLSLWLCRRYRNRYILDIRDFTHENIKPYYWLESLAIDRSKLCVLSSKKFQTFLPKREYLICHNIGNEAKENEGFHIKSSDPIVIGYIGRGGYIDKCKKLCELVRDDKRYEFRFYGIQETPEELKPFESCENISFNGIFTPPQKKDILRAVDILFNIYGNGTPLLDYALSNKLYDAFTFGKVILTSPNTYMSEMVGPLGFDVDFDKDENILERLYNWYQAINDSEIDNYCKSMLERILQENEETKVQIIDCITSDQKIMEDRYNERI